MRNPERRAVNVSLAVSVLGLLMMVAQPLLDVDVYKGGGAMMLIGAWLTLSGLLVAWLFRGRAAHLDRLLSGQEMLLHWRYDHTTWTKFQQVDQTALASEMKQMFMLVMWVSAAVCGFLFLVISRERWVFAAVFVGINLLTGAAALIRVRLASGGGVPRIHEVLIGTKAAFVDGTLHLWGSTGNRLDGVEVIESPMLLLLIRYSAITRYGWQHANIRIPVPEGQEAQAHDVVRKLRPARSKSK